MGADMRIQDKTRRLALCSLLSALGVVILYLGALIEILDLTMASLAPLLVVLVIIEVGGYWKWLVYLVTGLLAMLLLPSKTAAVLYLLCTGFYPIAKQFIESKLPRGIRLLAKLSVFHASVLLIWATAKLFAVSLVFDAAWYVVIGVLEFTFLLYDYALTRVITLYIRYWRKRFKK